MNRLIHYHTLFLTLTCLLGCVPTTGTHVPMGLLGVSIYDRPCKETIESIPKKLSNHNIRAEWLDKTHTVLKVGPIVSNPASAIGFSQMRQRYTLTVNCDDLVSTNIGLAATIEGLTAEGKWEEISDPALHQQLSTSLLKIIQSRGPTRH